MIYLQIVFKFFTSLECLALAGLCSYAVDSKSSGDKS